ncbi:MAG: hypothetical protein A3G20_09515 [Acidobacteria bacterium RIFCSPLOWO2_12_FULL_59_11]|nr:MAG: hypothetical protein A3G20_09515 [Acidobacteria bacterium RIFCSPLOWO2_12_FULL_59_11]
MTLNISEREAEILRTLLNRFVEETRSEIHHTDAVAYKDGLKTEEQAAKELLAKLTAQPIST